jgi:hypothetical protein
MGQSKGHTGNPYGRPKGIQNRATSLAREAIASFVEGNVDRLNGWLDTIAQTSPKDAFTCFMDVVEYHIPKLARTELTGKEGEAIETKIVDSDREIIERFLKEREKK